MLFLSLLFVWKIVLFKPVARDFCDCLITELIPAFFQAVASRNNRGESKTQELVVGARGFEPRTSCAQASGAISWKSFLFILVFENKGVGKIFGSGTMYGNIAPHA